jgi:hypothetical protein
MNGGISPLLTLFLTLASSGGLLTVGVQVWGQRRRRRTGQIQDERALADGLVELRDRERAVAEEARLRAETAERKLRLAREHASELRRMLLDAGITPPDFPE